MRTIQLIACVLLFGIITANAQKKQRIEFGIKGGVNFAKFRSESSKFKVGLIGGFFTRYNISEKFTIQSEALYSVQGAKSKHGSGKTKLNYIYVLPAMGKFYPTDRLYIEAGPQVGYLISGKGQGFRKSNYEKIDYGIATGVGYSITSDFEIGIRYNLSLPNISKINNTSIKNSVFQLSINFKI